jgi:PAS domain S-box-containing protein
MSQSPLHRDDSNPRPFRDASPSAPESSTSERRSEAELKQFALLADRCTEFIGVCDFDLKPIYINEAGLKLIGLDSLDQGRAVGVPNYFFPEDRPFIASNFLPRVMRDGKGETEIRFRHFKTGEPIWMIYNVFVLNDESGRPLGFATFSQNITDRKKIEESMRERERTLRAHAGGLQAQVQQRDREIDQRNQQLGQRDRELDERTQELGQRNIELAHQTDQVRELSYRMQKARDEERRLIARELHDSAGQVVAALGLNLAAIEALIQSAIADPSPQITEAITASQQLIDQLSKEIRTTSYLLHPPLLDEGGLATGIRWYSSGLTDRSSISIRLDIPDDFGRLSPEIELAAFRIVQESLTNIHRHSESKTAAIRLWRDTRNVYLEIQDQGKGIPAEKLAAQRTGVGIAGMRERVRLLSGTMNIGSSPAGTTISVCLPLSASSSPDSCPPDDASTASSASPQTPPSTPAASASASSTTASASPAEKPKARSAAAGKSS